MNILIDTLDLTKVWGKQGDTKPSVIIYDRSYMVRLDTGDFFPEIVFFDKVLYQKLESLHGYKNIVVSTKTTSKKDEDGHWQNSKLASAVYGSLKEYEKANTCFKSKFGVAPVIKPKPADHTETLDVDEQEDFSDLPK